MFTHIIFIFTYFLKSRNNIKGIQGIISSQYSRQAEKVSFKQTTILSRGKEKEKICTHEARCGTSTRNSTHLDSDSDLAHRTGSPLLRNWRRTRKGSVAMARATDHSHSGRRAMRNTSALRLRSIAIAVATAAATSH